MSITTINNFDISKMQFSKPIDCKVPNSHQSYMKVYISYNDDKLYIKNDGKVFIKSFSESSHTANVHLSEDNLKLINNISEAIAAHIETLGGLGNISNPVYETDAYSSLNVKILSDFESKQITTSFTDSNGKETTFSETPKNFTGNTIIQLDSIYLGKHNKIQYSLSEAKPTETQKKSKPRFL